MATKAMEFDYENSLVVDRLAKSEKALYEARLLIDNLRFDMGELYARLIAAENIIEDFEYGKTGGDSDGEVS